MPLIEESDRTVLKCVNHAHRSHAAPAVIDDDGTTMTVKEWNALSYMEPPSVQLPEGRFSQTILPVRAYVCRVCGYVELYAGTITDPVIWIKEERQKAQLKRLRDMVAKSMTLSERLKNQLAKKKK